MRCLFSRAQFMCHMQSVSTGRQHAFVSTKMHHEDLVHFAVLMMSVGDVTQRQACFLGREHMYHTVMQLINQGCWRAAPGLSADARYTMYVADILYLLCWQM